VKKLWCLLAISTMAFALTGCGTDLTEQETRIIGEYAADLLLKYDVNYQERLSEDTQEDVATETTEATEATTEAATDTQDVPDTETEQNAGTTENTESSSSEDDSVVPTVSGNTSNIAAIVGLEGISVQYNRCMFLDRYPSLDQDGAFIYLEAEPGYKLVVLKFDIINNTNEDKMVDLLDSGLDYRLVLNETKAAKPMLTILTDDLGTYKAVVPADTEQSAVLVFQMSDGLVDNIQSLNLRVMYQSQENTIQIQ